MRFNVLLFLPVFCFCLDGNTQVIALENSYEKYREPFFKDRRFKHADIKKLIEQLPSDLFDVSIAGKSIKGKEIYLIKIGTGETKVLLWSQMHGNEPTATMALFDIFNYLQHDSSRQKQQLLESISFYFIPMLNPDGADAFQRRNALDIDINRDALRLQSPESQILKNVRDELNPQWGFNLHDQNRYSSAGKSENMASISFLAPAFNEEKDWSVGRTQAMQLICKMNEILQPYIPGKIGRYSDEFEPRAFGDNIQKWGTNTILIETGALPDDPEKQYLRKLNYLGLVSAFYSIMSGDYQKFALADYEVIPFNENVLHDLIVRNAKLLLFNRDFIFDIAIRQDEIQDEPAKNYYLRAYIADLGDLHNFHGYEEFDAGHLEVRQAKLYSRRFVNLDELKKAGVDQLVLKGYTTFAIQTLPKPEIMAKLPFHLIKSEANFKPSNIKLGQNPVLTFWQDQEFRGILVNGNIYQPDDLSVTH